MAGWVDGDEVSAPGLSQDVGHHDRGETNQRAELEQALWLHRSHERRKQRERRRIGCASKFLMFDDFVQDRDCPLGEKRRSKRRVVSVTLTEGCEFSIVTNRF
jgi:hypothetical protein